MSARPIFLIVFLMFFWESNCSDGKEQIPRISTDEEFSGEVKTFVKAISDDTQRHKYKQQLLNMKEKGISTGRQRGLAEGRASVFMEFFKCGINVCKVSLEKPFDAFKQTFDKPEFQKELKDLPELPKEILTIFESRDKWIQERDERFYFISTTGPTPEPADLEKFSTVSPTQMFVKKLTNFFKKWLYIITVPIMFNTPLFVVKLQYSLDAFYTENHEHYNDDKDKFFHKVAACYARSYALMTAVHHHILAKLKDHALQNPDLDFPDVLFSLLPKWYLTEEDVTFINILISALSHKKNVIPVKTVLMKNKVSESDNENDWVVIPYDDSPKCGHLDLNKISTITPSAHIIYKTYRTPNF